MVELLRDQNEYKGQSVERKVEEYAKIGLRTLVFAKKEIS